MIGFDIGGTKCAVSVGEITEEGIKITNKTVTPTDFSVSPESMIDKMCTLAEEMTDDFSKIGISCGGPLDSKSGVILSPPNLKGWDNVDIVRMLTERYNGSVKLCNDADACALAEWRYGAGRGCENMIFLTFGTGLGAGLIINGRLYSGSHGMAGEAGHIRLAGYGPVGYGKAGSFEGFASGGGIAGLGRIRAEEAKQRGKTVSWENNCTAKGIAECAASGCSDAIEIYRESGRKLGEGLSVLMDILDPDKIVIGGIFPRAEDLLRDAMEEAVSREALNPCPVVSAELGENIGDIAALCVAMEA